MVSIRPFLQPKAGNSASSQAQNPSDESSSDVRASHLSAPGGGSDSKSLVTSAQEDEIFSCGRDVVVDWRMAGWVTMRDQVSRPRRQSFLRTRPYTAVAVIALLSVGPRCALGSVDHRHGYPFDRSSWSALPGVTRTQRPNHGRTPWQGRGRRGRWRLCQDGLLEGFRTKHLRWTRDSCSLGLGLDLDLDLRETWTTMPSRFQYHVYVR